MEEVDVKRSEGPLNKYYESRMEKTMNLVVRNESLKSSLSFVYTIYSFRRHSGNV